MIAMLADGTEIYIETACNVGDLSVELTGLALGHCRGPYHFLVLPRSAADQGRKPGQLYREVRSGTLGAGAAQACGAHASHVAG